MAEWRYQAMRLNGDGTSTLIDPDLPLQGPSLTSVLSGPAGHTSSITPAAQRLLTTGPKPILVPWSTAIIAFEDDVVRHGTILTDEQTQGPGISLTGVGFSGYLKGVPYQGEKFFVETDPLDIVRHMWAYAQGRPRGNIGLTLSAKKVGVLIGKKLQQVQFDSINGPAVFESGPYKLNWWETDDLGGKADELAAQYFEYQERHALSADGEDVLHFLDFGVPRIGTRRPDLRFVVGENIIVDPQASRAGSAYASEVIVRGAGEGRTMIQGYASRAGETRLARPAIVEDKQIKSKAAANTRAAAELALRMGLPDLDDVSVMDTRAAPLGSWREGDEIEIHVEGDWDTFSAWFRVLSTTITPEDPSVAKLSLARVDMIDA